MSPLMSRISSSEIRLPSTDRLRVDVWGTPGLPVALEFSDEATDPPTSRRDVGRWPGAVPRSGLSPRERHPH